MSAARAGRVVQAQDLALDRAHRDPRGVRIPSSWSDHEPAAITTAGRSVEPSSSATPVTTPAETSLRRDLDARGPPAGALDRRAQRRDQRPRVDRAVVGHVEREAQRGREPGSSAPRLARSQALDAQASALRSSQLALQRLGLVGVARDEQRPAPRVTDDRLARHSAQLRHEARIRRGAASPSSSSGCSLRRRPRLIGASIPAATCEVPAPGSVALQHDHAQAPRCARATRSRGRSRRRRSRQRPRCWRRARTSISLRRHYPARS